jgi:hypothetical protein
MKGEENLARQVAEMTDLSISQAKELIRRYGGDLRKFEEAAKTYKA